MKMLTKKTVLDQISLLAHLPWAREETFKEDQRYALALLDIAYKCKELKIKHLKTSLLFSHFYLTSENQLLGHSWSETKLMYGAAAVFLHNAISISGGSSQIPSELDIAINAKYGHLSEYRKIA